MRMAKVISEVSEHGQVHIKDGNYNAWASFIMPSHDVFIPPEKDAWVLVDYIDQDEKHPVVLATIQCDRFMQNITFQMGSDKSISLKKDSIEITNKDRSFKMNEGKCDFYHQNEGVLNKLKELLQEILNTSSQYALTPCGPGTLDPVFLAETEKFLAFLEEVTLS
jgi:hypothetical protein